MKPTTLAGCALLATASFASAAAAESYDFEIGLAYSGGEFDGSQTILTNGGTVFNSVSTDTDDLNLVGTWYFKGLSDDKGPRARAALVDRASALSIGYVRSEQTISTLLTSDDPNFPFPPIDTTLESEGDLYGLDLRYVDRDSGWVGSIGVTSTSTKLGGSFSGSADVTAWRLGIGKYLAANTTLGLDVSQTDADGGLDATGIGVSLEHLGDLGQSWQYAVDVRYENVDSDGLIEVDTVRAALSFYPNRDVEFGIALEDASGIGSDVFGVEGFASWFVTPGFRVSAGYRVDDVDFLGNVAIGGAPRDSDADQSSFSIGASVRF
jgi:hypothetical protein